MPTRVFLLRHAESADPTVFHGAESDIGLSERGVQQAATVAKVLAREQPQVLVSSGMRRALATADPIAAACSLRVHVENDLHERRIGGLAGTSFRSSDGVWLETLRRWMAGETSYAPQGAESFEDIRRRVLPVWERVTTTHAGQTLVVVSHGAVCKVLLMSLLPEWSVADWQRLGPIQNVALTELICEPERWRAVRLNELPHEVVV